MISEQISHQIDFNPIRTLGALNVLLTSIAALAILAFGLPATVAVLIYGVVNAIVLFAGSFFAEPATVSKAALEAYAAAVEVPA